MPMRDRLEELQQQRKLLEKGASKPGRDNSTKKIGGDKTMQSFLNDASKIEEQVTEMKADVAEIKRLKQTMFSTPFPDKKDAVKYESLGAKVRNDATKLGHSLKQLESKYETNDLPDTDAFKRVRIQQLNTLTSELNISTNEFFKIQADYMDKMKERMLRHLEVKKINFDDSKVNALLDQDYSVFIDNYIADVHNAEQTLRDIQDREKSILALEKSVTDVNLLFKEMNLLVSNQGAKLVTIESMVENTTVQVESGKKELQQADIHRKRARRKKCCIIIIILVILVIIAIIIASIFASK